MLKGRERGLKIPGRLAGRYAPVRSAVKLRTSPSSVSQYKVMASLLGKSKRMKSGTGLVGEALRRCCSDRAWFHDTDQE